MIVRDRARLWTAQARQRAALDRPRSPVLSIRSMRLRRRSARFEAISETRSTPCRSRLRDRVLRLRVADHGAPVALERRAVLWSTPMFGFVTLPDASAPAARSCRRRKIPMPELVRGKTGRVIGDLAACSC